VGAAQRDAAGSVAAASLDNGAGGHLLRQRFRGTDRAEADADRPRGHRSGVETINVVAFALASILGSVVFLIAIDGWVALALLGVALPLSRPDQAVPAAIRATSTARAAARANVTGQVVDTITNIKTVKLFAHAGTRGPQRR
jgi:ABC-type multidrug transport system fused ATPase/permease subunit